MRLHQTLEEALAATEGVFIPRPVRRQVSVDLFFQPGDIDEALNDATAAFNRGRGQYRTIWRLKSRDCSKLTLSCLNLG